MSNVIAVSENFNSGQNNLTTLAVNVLQLKVKDDYMFIITQLSKVFIIECNLINLLVIVTFNSLI